MTNSRELAEAVRAACIKAALEAYEEGGVLGLCAEGRWEYAISALRQLDVAAVVAAWARRNPESVRDTG
ncbi:MAG: acetyltransferase [Candidatus Competibacter sp.]|nr:acetyltransferase [Candidatus Competibacter sp.]